MHVLFTSKIEEEIAGFHPYTFYEAVEKTAELDTKWKKKNAHPVALDFMISNDEGDKLYNGTYVLGSDETTHIYDHVCRKLVQLPMNNEQQETERDILLQNLTAHTPTSYQIDVTELLKEDKSKSSGWRQLSKRGKIMSGSLIGLIVITLFTSFCLVFMVSSQSEAMQDLNQELADVKTTKNVYERALTGELTEAIDKLQAETKRSESEHNALVHLLLKEKNYEEAVKRAGKEQIARLASQVIQLHGVEELKVFQKSYPSPAGAFDVAYHTDDYEGAVAVKDVPMTTDRYKEKGLAYLKIDKLKEAKKMASEAKSDALNEKISKYEQLEHQIAKLHSQIKAEKNADDKNQDKMKELKEQKADKQREQNNM